MSRIVTDPEEPRNIDEDDRSFREELGDIVPLVKAHFIERDGTATSNVIATDESRSFQNAGALKPPFDPETLITLYQHSNSLRPNIDAYHTNIDGFGHRFEPVIDLEDEDADEQIRNAIFLDRIHDAGDTSEVPDESQMPTDEEVAAKRKEIELQMRLELSKLNSFFDFCCTDISFPELRQRMRQDKEIIGWGAWEVLRNSDGDIVQLNYVPGFSVRLLPIDPRPTDVTMNVRVSALSFEEVEMKRRFRRFVQVFEQSTIYFKEFGDPRTVSMKTGKIIPVNAEGEPQFDEEDDGEATELLYFPIHNPESAYGVPRWIGALLSVIGSRQSEEVNFLYFDNKSVPPMALLVSGGRLSGNSVDRIRDFIKNNIRGRKNFHSIMVIEAETPQGKAADNSGRVKVEMKPLTSAQHNDALFQKYDERNIDKVGMAFRLPRMLRGDIRDFNRSTADAALAFAEMQVFQPEREDFDFTINRKLLLNEMGIRYWRFVSNAPVTRDPTEVAKMIKDLMNSNAVTALDVRPLLAEVFNRKFRTVRAEWAKQPIPLTVAGIRFDDEGNVIPEGEPGDGDDVDPDATPEAEEEAFGEALNDLDELLEMADASTGTLTAAGGKRPAQTRRFRHLPPATKVTRALDEYALVRQAIKLVRLREALNKAAKESAEAEFSKDTAKPRDAGD